MLLVLIDIMVGFYLIAILFVLFHSLFDAHLIFHYLKSNKKEKAKTFEKGYTPFVTIQLPIFNELHVVERLIDAVAVIEYPNNKIEIQVLDDSTDETTQVIANKISTLNQKNIQIHHIKRDNREGFKAGALKYGLSLSKGEFIAVFDADFLPAKDFLLRTIPYFNDDNIGMVQTKWGHVNKESSLLARLQAIALDGHFSIEQQGRNNAGYFINFNGTAGIWRKETILDAGNWQADTLTEDLDLSYRAQMKGWKFKYLQTFTTPAELPPLMSALKSQQFRWTKGGAETAKKNLKRLFSSTLAYPVKLHGAFHLIYSFGFVSIILFALLTVPLLFVKQHFPQYDIFLELSKLVGVSFLIYVLHYLISYFNNTNGSIWKKISGFLLYFPLFVSLFIGLSLSNSIGIIQGYWGIKTGFVRTPKFNSLNSTTNAIESNYASFKINWVTITEGVLIFYFLFGLIQAIQFKNYGSIPLLTLAFVGFTMVFSMSILEKTKKASMK